MKEDEVLVAQLAARLSELEARLAFQDQALEQLSDALAAARTEVDRLTRRVLRAEAQLKDIAPGAAGAAADEPPPPHY